MLALGCLGASMLVDVKPAVANYVRRQGVFLLEDGLKLCGLGFWVGYHLLASDGPAIHGNSRAQED